MLTALVEWRGQLSRPPSRGLLTPVERAATRRVESARESGGVGMLDLVAHGHKLDQLIEIAARNAFACEDCLRLCSEWRDHEYVMLHDALWEEVSSDTAALLCLLCIEARLGRRLVMGDLMPDVTANRCWVLEQEKLSNLAPHGEKNGPLSPL